MPALNPQISERILLDLTRHFDERLGKLVVDYLSTCKASGQIARDDAAVALMVSLMQTTCYILETMHPNFPAAAFKDMAEAALEKVRADLEPNQEGVH